MRDKWINSETFPKNILTSLIYSVIFIIIGAFLLFIDTSFLYGVILGVIIQYLSYLIIWVLWYCIPNIKTAMAKATPFLAPIIRILIFLTTFLLIVFLVNTGEGTEKFLQPINLLMTLITYTFTIVSYGTVLVIDSILKKQKGEEK